MRLYTILLYFCKTALHVSGDTLIHHQEHTQTVIRASGTGRTVFATVRWCGGVRVLTPPRQQMVANTVQPVPDAVITLWVCSWWWMRVSPETCRAVLEKYNKAVYSLILMDNYWHRFTTHGPMNVKYIGLREPCAWGIQTFTDSHVTHCVSKGWYHFLPLIHVYICILTAGETPFGSWDRRTVRVTSTALWRTAHRVAFRHCWVEPEDRPAKSTCHTRRRWCIW